MENINISEFKAICLRLLEQIRQTGEPIQVLKNGEPIVVVYPAPIRSERSRSFGALRGTLVGPEEDLISPLKDIVWEATES